MTLEFEHDGVEQERNAAVRSTVYMDVGSSITGQLCGSWGASAEREPNENRKIKELLGGSSVWWLQCR